MARMADFLSEKCSTQELETQLQFQFLPQISFESKEDEEEIYLRGIDKEKKNTISPEALELGKQFKKDIENSYLPSVSIRWIHNDVVYGLFAEKGIDEGNYAGEYTGIVRRNDRRYFEPLNNYCYEYPVPDEV